MQLERSKQTGALLAPKVAQSGLSLVELLVGVAVGLFVIGGATKLMVDYLLDNRRVLLETRVNQDLRVAADVLIRELRRAGYWSNAATGAVYPAAQNPYRTVSPDTAATNTTAFSYDATGSLGGFRLASAVVNGSNVGVIETQFSAGGGWQQLTDPNSVNITGFSVTPNIQTASLGAYCSPVCAAGSAGCPTVAVRRYDILITGAAVSDARVIRQFRESVRIRNDYIPTPSCP